MKTLTARQQTLLVAYLGMILLISVAAAVIESATFRVLLVVIALGLIGAVQLLFLLSIRNLLGLLRKEERLRHSQRQKESTGQVGRIVSAVDPTRQTAKMMRAREEMADLARVLARRENDVAQLAETLQRIEFELTLANSQDIGFPEKTVLSPATGSDTPADSYVEEH